VFLLRVGGDRGARGGGQRPGQRAERRPSTVCVRFERVLGNLRVVY
jgi:hypothetical protein